MKIRDILDVRKIKIMTVITIQLFSRTKLEVWRSKIVRFVLESYSVNLGTTGMTKPEVTRVNLFTKGVTDL